MIELLPSAKVRDMKFVPTMWLLRLYPPSPPVIEHRREWAVKGASPRRVRRLCP